jgi:hypothetical protein
MGDGVKNISPERKQFCEELRKLREEAFSPIHIISSQKQRPEDELSCLRDSYNLKVITDFQLLIGKSLNQFKEIQTFEDLLGRRNSLYLFEQYYEDLKNPKSGLRVLINEIKRANYVRPIKLFLDDRVHGNKAAYFIPSLDLAGLINTMAAPSSYRSFSITNLYHELGHMVMYHLYGKREPDGLYLGHEYRFNDLFEAKANLGIAWNEGFADAMKGLDYFDRRPVTYRDFKNPKWTAKSLQDKLGNEYLVKGVLSQYLENCDDKCHRVDLVKLRKIFNVMERAGVQNSLQEFLVDYVSIYPQNKEGFVSLLKKYHVVETDTDVANFFGIPNYAERRIIRFVESIDKYSDSLENSPVARAWKMMKNSGVRSTLLSREVPIEKRKELVWQVIHAIEQEALKDHQASHAMKSK